MGEPRETGVWGVELETSVSEVDVELGVSGLFVAPCTPALSLRLSY